MLCSHATYVEILLQSGAKNCMQQQWGQPDILQTGAVVDLGFVAGLKSRPNSNPNMTDENQ